MLYLARPSRAIVNAYLQKNCQQIVPSHFRVRLIHHRKISFSLSLCTFGNRKKYILPITDMWQSHSPPLRSKPLKSSEEVWGTGERCTALPAGSGAQPQLKLILVHGSLQIWHLVATLLMIFVRINFYHESGRLIRTERRSMPIRTLLFWPTYNCALIRIIYEIFDRPGSVLLLRKFYVHK